MVDRSATASRSSTATKPSGGSMAAPAASGESAALDAFKAFKANAPRKTQQIAIQVDEYDLQARQFVGTRVDTGDVIRVELANYKNPPDRKPRPEIEDFANPRAKVHCEPGAIIRFDRASEDPKREGVWAANWAVGMTDGPNPEQGYFLQGLARPLPVKQDQRGKPIQTVQVLLPERAQLVDAQRLPLRDALVSAIDKLEPGLPFAVVRGEAMVDGELVVKTAIIHSQVERDGDNFVVVPPEQTVDKWLDEPFGRQVAQFASHVRTEVIPGTSLRVGADTLTKTVDSKRTYDLQFRNKEGDLGWAPAFVAVGFKDTAPFVKDLARVDTFGPVHSSDDVPTPFTQRAVEPELPNDLNAGLDDELDGVYDHGYGP